MRKGLGRTVALALCLILALTACTRETQGPSEFDAEVYVTGVLKATYLGEFDPDYLDMVGMTASEAQTEYENGIRAEMSNFYSAYSIETSTDELEEEIKELYHQIYSHASLTVAGVESREDGSFLVTVEVAPIDIVRQVHEVLPEAQEKFLANYPEEIRNTMTTEEYTAFDAAWGELVVGLYQEKLETIGNLPVQAVPLRVEKDSQGYYGLNREDFLALDKLVIDYDVPPLSAVHDHDHEGEGEPEESPTPSESPAPQESQTPDEGDAVQTGGQPSESQAPQESQPAESPKPQESQKPSESPKPQESVNPNDPTPPTTGTPVPGLE